jgi:SAM-dependent MidA family methyltransferase
MDGSEADLDLRERLRAACARPGGLSFREFMELALYDPADGYYASGRARIGRGGDFFTSVSVGPCFGGLLALRIASWWQANGCPDGWRLCEQGANDGRLLRDVLDGLAGRTAPPLVELVEPSPVLAARQRATLAGWEGEIRWLEKLGAATGDPPAVFLANELLDAFPCERVRRCGGAWVRMRVESSPDGFRWREAPLCDPALAAELAALPVFPWPEGYTTELRTGFAEWAAALAGHLRGGLALLADYGFTAEDYFHPDRSDGTLQAYAGHRVQPDPLAEPGRRDLSAHVDWTALVRALAAAGLRPGEPVDPRMARTTSSKFR